MRLRNGAQSDSQGLIGEPGASKSRDCSGSMSTPKSGAMKASNLTDAREKMAAVAQCNFDFSSRTWWMPSAWLAMPAELVAPVG